MIPKLLVTAALMAAQVAIGMTRKTFGPRLDNLKTTTAEYGTPIPRFWGKRKFECPLIWAEDLREEKKTGKGKGGKSTEYKYFGTFAALVCDHEIEAITRIWMDDKLVYDVTKGGPVSLGGAAGVNVNRNMRVYLGTETQNADPRMEAWCEDRYGPDSCPAYRGSTYVVFEELPLEKFGNRIPNVTIEAVSTKVSVYPFDTIALANAGTQMFTSSDFTRTLHVTYQNPPGQNIFSFDIVDMPTRSAIVTGVLANPDNSLLRGYAYDSDGTIWCIAGDRLRHISADGLGLVGDVTIGSLDGGACFPIGGAVYITPNTTLTEAFFIVAGGGASAIATPGVKVTAFTEWNGSVYGIGAPSGGGSVKFVTMSGAVISLPELSPAGGNVSTGVRSDGRLVVYQHGYFGLLAEDMLGWDTVSADTGFGDVTALGAGPTFYEDSAWYFGAEFDLDSFAVVRDVDISAGGPWTPGGLSGTQTTFDPVNRAWFTRATGSATWRFLDRVDSDGVTLKTVVDDVSEWCGLTGQDTLALTQTVLGYSVSQGTGKDMLGPLLDMHDVDARPHDFAVQFVNRGGAPSGSLLTPDFVRDGDSPRYTVTIQQDTDLPKEISAKFADVDHDQQTNTAIAQRPLDATDSKRTEEIDLSTLADTADGAQQKLERLFRRIWNSRERIKLSLTAQHLALEPGDVTTPSLDGLARNARLDKLTIRGSVLDCEFVRDETSFAALSNSTGAPIEGNDVDVITIPGASKGFVLDTPLAQDADADINPLLYIAAGPYAGSWPGALAYEGDALIASIESDTKATWGYATSTLAPANPSLWDRGNTLNVTVFGTLVSSTEAAIDADPTINLCAVGIDGRWELLNFTTATLTGTSGAGNTYTLSGFKRGRRGTEGNVGNHAIGDSVVLMNMAHIVERGADDIGDALSFRVQTIGRDPESTPEIVLTFTGATLKPYAPARVKWTTDGTDMFGEIVRRTRVGGAWIGGSTIPLVENSEAYEVVIGGRTISVTGNTFTYAAADITADGNTVGVAPSATVYQLSDTVGRGFALAA